MFAMANLETVIAGKEVTGNIGVRYIQTDQSSNAFAQSGGSLIRQTVKHDYSNTLPSMNLRVALDDQQTLCAWGCSNHVSPSYGRDERVVWYWR